MQIVMIGNSAAGLSALETFRKYDQRFSVIVISKETESITGKCRQLL